MRLTETDLAIIEIFTLEDNIGGINCKPDEYSLMRDDAVGGTLSRGLEWRTLLDTRNNVERVLEKSIENYF